MSIAQKIDFVFVPVKDMDRAVHFYSQLFGLDERPGPHGTLFNLDISSPNIVLDSNAKDEFTPSTHPLFALKSDHIDEDYQKIKNMNVDISEVHNFGDVRFFVITDPEGNKVMVVN